MGKIIFLVAILLTVVMPGMAADCPIIPLPAKVTRTEGRLDLGNLKQIRVQHESLLPVAGVFQNELLRHTGIAIPLRSEGQAGNSVTLALDPAMQTGDEGYKLDITPSGITIKARTVHGVFNGVMSSLQLARVAAVNNNLVVDCWRIEDAPEMKWRGVMLDESRHFFGMDMVKSILDWMALYKLNRFHWHLTDVPGWRIEIKSFPKLTVIGGVGNHTDSLAPAKYYTQEQIREIVGYASERFIEVIPEIDMPGHAKAANRAYPEYSGGGSAKYPEFTFNPGKEETYAYLTKILREVDVMFPSKMIHLGGDEVHFGNEKWKSDRHVLDLMKRERLPDLKAVERYFVERMADSITRLDAKVLGWDEIADTRIKPDKAIIFWWRHNLPETLKRSIDNGYQVVLCPRIPLYLDFVQDSAHRVGRKWQGAFSDLKTIYFYSTNSYGDFIKGKRRDQIVGLQGNVWTEVISSDARLEYMLYPRISAVAEAAWTDPKTRNYDKFLERLSGHELLYKKEKLHYYDVKAPYTTPEIIR